MKKIASLLMGLVMFAATSFSQAKPATPKSAAKSATTTSAPAAKMKKDGTPDKRFKENKAVGTPATVGPLKKDGTPDKRYKKNKG